MMIDKSLKTFYGKGFLGVLKAYYGRKGTRYDDSVCFGHTLPNDGFLLVAMGTPSAQTMPPAFVVGKSSSSCPYLHKPQHGIQTFLEVSRE